MNPKPTPSTLQVSPQSRGKRLSTSTRMALITIPAVALVFLILILVSASNQSAERDRVAATVEPGTPQRVVAANSHVVDDAGEGAPTLVEFLDFECEACGALYPVIEEIRKQYDGDINFVVRYFPIAGHLNSMNAAVAVEAAAQQNKFEEMYQKMLSTQNEWGEKKESEAPRFRAYAEQLGLDMQAFDAAVSDPATQARVEEDLAAGETLGVQGTPTFFLEGNLLQPTQISDITDALDQAIASRN